MTQAEQYFRDHMTDPEAFFKLQVKLARRRAIILGTTTISLLCLMFAFVQKEEAKILKAEHEKTMSGYKALIAEHEKCKLVVR
jgi:hypothetical protein